MDRFAKALLGLSVVLLASPGVTAPVRLFAGGSWAALDRGAVCEAAALSERIVAKGQVQAVAGFTFTPDRRRWGEFYARLRRPVRPGSTVLLTIGGQPFMLVARGDWAWSRGAAQEAAIIAAVRGSGRMNIDSRDTSGRRWRDPYRLDGAPTAIDAAAARCAGKMR
jgi:hypothetical protein